MFNRTNTIARVLMLLFMLHTASAFASSSGSESADTKSTTNKKEIKNDDDIVNWFKVNRSYHRGKWANRNATFEFHHDYLIMGNKKYLIVSWDRTKRTNFFTLRDSDNPDVTYYLTVDRKDRVVSFYSDSAFSAKTYYYISMVVK